MIMNFLIFSALAIMICSWTTYEREGEMQDRPEYSWEPYDEEDRKN